MTHEDDLHHVRGIMTYEQLCRGEEFMTEEERFQLLCCYLSGRYPYLTIGPVKEEEIFLDPLIVIFHNMVSDSELETVRSLAAPSIETGAVFYPVTYRLEKKGHHHDNDVRTPAGDLTMNSNHYDMCIHEPET